MSDSKRLCVHLIDSAIAQLDGQKSEAQQEASSRSASDMSPPSPSSSVSSGGDRSQGEQIIGIFDLEGFSVPRNADFAFAAFMVEAFFEYYPRRVSQVGDRRVRNHGRSSSRRRARWRET